MLAHSSVDKSHTGQHQVSIFHRPQLCGPLPDFQAKWMLLPPLHLAMSRAVIPSRVLTGAERLFSLCLLSKYWHFSKGGEEGRGRGRENERNGQPTHISYFTSKLAHRALAVTNSRKSPIPFTEDQEKSSLRYAPYQGLKDGGDAPSIPGVGKLFLSGAR